MTELKKTVVKNGRLWKFGLLYLALSLALFVVGLATGRASYSLANVFVALALLTVATRFRALQVQCNGKTLLLIPDYSTSTIVLTDLNGNVLLRELFPFLEGRKIETPCGPLEVRAAHRRFGKVEILVNADDEEITLP
ncbi:MAG: hypothetical protein J7L37_09375 [Thermococcus sp.]|nr:hypothetical protein [Thermococcus sp.]